MYACGHLCRCASRSRTATTRAWRTHWPPCAKSWMPPPQAPSPASARHPAPAPLPGTSASWASCCGGALGGLSGWVDGPGACRSCAPPPVWLALPLPPHLLGNAHARRFARVIAVAPRRRSEELQLPHLVVFSRLSLARFQLLHPHQPAAAAPGAAAAGTAGTGVSSEQPCTSSLAVAGAQRDAAHLHMATCLAAATPPAPPAGSGTASARVLRGVADLFTASSLLFGPSMQGARLAMQHQITGWGRVNMRRGACPHLPCASPF